MDGHGGPARNDTQQSRRKEVEGASQAASLGGIDPAGVLCSDYATEKQLAFDIQRLRLEQPGGHPGLHLVDGNGNAEGLRQDCPHGKPKRR
ncbi:MAG TPA: hypothetical protein VID29_02305 [Solirubrobacteraceae bacterium]|jgi:hypothetical protein